MVLQKGQQGCYSILNFLMLHDTPRDCISGIAINDVLQTLGLFPALADSNTAGR